LFNQSTGFGCCMQAFLRTGKAPGGVRNAVKPKAQWAKRKDDSICLTLQ